MTFTETQTHIVEWAKAKDLNNPDRQYLKFLEELGELSGAILKGDRAAIADEFGDVGVTLTILAWQTKVVASKSYATTNDFNTAMYDLVYDAFHMVVFQGTWYVEAYETLARLLNLNAAKCLEAAYNKIANRTGKTIDGTFIKDAQ